MIERRLSYGDIVEYDDGHYTYLKQVLSKHPDTGAWYEAIEYECTERGAVYVREKKDFMAKFSFVEQPVDDTVMAQPLFNEQSHQAWGADCPHCGQYWESLGTEKEAEIECDKCEQKFTVIYPGEKR